MHFYNISVSAASDPVTGIVTNLVSSSACISDLNEGFHLSGGIPPASGDLVVASVREVNPLYPGLELEDGSEIVLERGNILIGVLGSRRALLGFSGRVPASLEIGQPLHLLNKGGVIGECTAFNRKLEWPTSLEFLGTVTREDKALNLGQYAQPIFKGPLPEVPMVMILGTCMNAGKTTVARQIIDVFTRRGLQINAGKVAGVACRRDILSMKKSGAEKVMSFHDFGFPSSSEMKTLLPVARSLHHSLSENNPDFIVMEMGDGILGGYQVSSLFEDSEYISRAMCTVICANDLMGVWGALQWLKPAGISAEDHPVLISGPVTDSGEGVDYIENNWGVTAANALDSKGKICQFINEVVEKC
ncbi:MAG: hypothetical protein ABIJ42_00050 [Acidobacteriota bacterium]